MIVHRNQNQNAYIYVLRLFLNCLPSESSESKRDGKLRSQEMGKSKYENKTGSQHSQYDQKYL